MHSNIGACTLFAATSGASIATAATVGTVAIPQTCTGGYNERLFMGTLAAGGTLGILIPPSINMIVLWPAHQYPGAEIVSGGVRLRPDAGRAVHGHGDDRLPVPARLGRSADSPQLAGPGHQPARDLVPPMLIFLAVVGSIYAGLATPTIIGSMPFVIAMLVMIAALVAWPQIAL